MLGDSLTNAYLAATYIKFKIGSVYKAKLVFLKLD